MTFLDILLKYLVFRD